jgi:hypothetical protein
MKAWEVPEGHPISIEKAKEIMAGDLADVCRDILRKCCAPIYWFDRRCKDGRILNNGTVTFVQTPERLLGVTAAHVLNAYMAEAKKMDLRVQIWDAEIGDLNDRIIDISDKYDLATFCLDDGVMTSLGKESQPLANWPPQPPQEGRGIMLAGFPAVERKEMDDSVEFGLFTALVIARTVTDIQITWRIEPEAQLANVRVAPPPPLYGIGGASGGPLVTWLESESHIATFTLGGIITEHPNYEENEFHIERVIATRADLIKPSGHIWG